MNGRAARGQNPGRGGFRSGLRGGRAGHDPPAYSPLDAYLLRSSIQGDRSEIAFDIAYARLEVQDHKQDIEDTKTEIRQGANARVRHLARTDLPVLRTHLKLSKKALRAAQGR